MSVRARLLAEDGIAMPVAIAVLALCLTLTGLVASSSDVLTRTSAKDQQEKRALAAADAGVALAIRRLRNLPYLENAHCLTTVGVAPGTPPASAGECPGHSEDLGDYASFTYHVSPAYVGGPGTCYEVPGQTIPANYLRRCITAIGTVHGTTRRVQRQVVAPPLAARQWVGVIGLESVLIHNSAHMSACNAVETPGPKIATNGSVQIDNSSHLNWGNCPGKPPWGVEIGPAGTASIHPGAQPSGTTATRVAQPFTIPPPPRDWEDAENTNNNAAVASSSRTATTWNPGQRNLTVATGGTMTFSQGGDYSLCNLSIGTDGVLDFPANQRTRIFIDSPRRPGSSCNSSSGVEFGTRSRVNWPSSVSDTDTANLTIRGGNVELYIYDVDFTLGNSARYAGLVQADRSTANFTNGSSTYGAAAARRIVVNNSGNFNRPDQLWGRDGYGPEFRSAGWGECRSVAPVATDPESGCV